MVVPDSDMLTALEAAALLRCGRTTVFRLMHDGDLPSTKVGRARLVPKRAVIDYLDRQLHAAASTPTVDPEPVSGRD